MFQVLEKKAEWRPLTCYVPVGQKALELQMFSEDCAHKHYQLEQFRKDAIHPESLDNNKYYVHLEWLMQRGENRTCKIICPHCGKKPVSFFRSGTVFGGTKKYFSQNHNFIYCEDCVKTLDTMKEWIFPFKFSAIRSLYRKYDRNYLREVIALFKYVFGLKPRLTKEDAFEFFHQEPITIVNSDNIQSAWTEPIPSGSKRRQIYEGTIPLQFG